MARAVPIIRQHDEGERLRWAGGGVFVMKASADETAGALMLHEFRSYGGKVTPLHLHPNEDEGFYVLEGEVTLFTPGAEVTLRPGEFFLAPRGIPHTYRVGGEPARWLVSSTPAGFERFVAAVAALEELDPAILTAVAAEHRIEILGPPGAMP